MGRALGEFEQLILFALVELEDEAYGAAIGRAIEARTGRSVSAGAIYTALDRLASRGLVTSWVGEPTGERGGRRRKYYGLEPAGAAELSRSVAVIRSMSEGLMPKLEAITGSEIR
ncbi:MAG: helix-turn-helix transcriptional regulator [Gemmatimonadota bacterium]